MQRYRRLNGESGVTAFESGPDWIKVAFVDGRVYTYTYDSAGASRVEHMKMLGNAGKGLSSYISREVRERYATRST